MQEQPLNHAPGSGFPYRQAFWVVVLGVLLLGLAIPFLMSPGPKQEVQIPDTNSLLILVNQQINVASSAPPSQIVRSSVKTLETMITKDTTAVITDSGNSSTPGGDVVGPIYVPLLLKLPMPAYKGIVTDIPLAGHLERPSDKPRPPFLVPEGATNVALHKPVTSSDPRPVNGSLDLVTDGEREWNDSSFLELHRRLQWVQIDLDGKYATYAILIWHAFDTPQVYHDVVVEVADDVGFAENVRTLFNNDWDNSAGLGTGSDKEYFESHEGRLIDAKGAKARYVRVYSNGSTFSSLNRYTEVEVYGLTAQ